ncbi:MAG: YihY family inner membrane protein [Gammaproteobacteria bacterium]|nr:YihY family inner membrane protein [Gammaproteobacteria bacterium]
MLARLHRWRLFFISALTLFAQKNCRQNAAALTYMTLFAIVPLATVSYAMLSLFPDFAGLESQLQQQIFSHFVPQSGREIQNYINSFSIQAQRLTGVGIAVLALTAGLMLRNIEGVFNSIWDVAKGRRGISSFLLYWAILSLGPILLGAGMAASTYLFSQKLFLGGHYPSGLLPITLRILSWLFTAAAFTLLFIAVPNCRVPLRHGLVGGVITAISFEVAKNLFSSIVAKSSLQAIYGAFAFVPLFLIWVYLLWIIVLAGCVLVRSFSIYQPQIQGREQSDLLAALALLWQFFQHHQRGLPLQAQYVAQLNISADQWQRILQILLNKKIITETGQDEYVLTQDLNQITLQQVTHWLYPGPISANDLQQLRQQRWFLHIGQRFNEVYQFTQERLGSNLGELFRQALLEEQKTTRE